MLGLLSINFLIPLYAPYALFTPETIGFFFGSNADDHYAEADREFIVQARAAIKQGYTVVYSSWW